MLQASGEWEKGTSQARLSIRSNLNPVPILKAFTGLDKKKDEPTFQSAPQIESEVTADFTKPNAGLRVIGSFLAPGITYKGGTFHFRPNEDHLMATFGLNRATIVFRPTRRSPRRI
jgi:hypothetical protein